MNISYLLSILDLYLLKEKDGYLIIEIDNILEIVKIKFSYSFDSTNKTFVKIDKKMFFENIKYFLNKIQGNLTIQDEKIKNINNQKIYQVIFSNQRNLSFINFKKEELKIIRSNLNSSKLDFDFNENINYNDVFELNKNNNLSFQMGFSSYMTLFIISIFLSDIFMISLFIFKVFIK